MLRSSGWEGFDDQFPQLFAASYKVAYKILGAQGDCEALAQEAVTRALVRWPRVKSHAVAWVCRVTTNLALDAVREQAKTRRYLLAEELGSAMPDTDLALDMAATLCRLPRRQRQVLAARYFADLSDREIAADLGITVGSVKKHAARGLAAIRGRDRQAESR